MRTFGAVSTVFRCSVILSFICVLAAVGSCQQQMRQQLSADQISNCIQRHWFSELDGQVRLWCQHDVGSAWRLYSISSDTDGNVLTASFLMETPSRYEHVGWLEGENSVETIFIEAQDNHIHLVESSSGKIKSLEYGSNSATPLFTYDNERVVPKRVPSAFSFLVANPYAECMAAAQSAVGEDKISLIYFDLGKASDGQHTGLIKSITLDITDEAIEGEFFVSDHQITCFGDNQSAAVYLEAPEVQSRVSGARTKYGTTIFSFSLNKQTVEPIITSERGSFEAILQMPFENGVIFYSVGSDQLVRRQHDGQTQSFDLIGLDKPVAVSSGGELLIAKRTRFRSYPYLANNRRSIFDGVELVCIALGDRGAEELSTILMDGEWRVDSISGFWPGQPRVIGAVTDGNETKFKIISCEGGEKS